MKKVNIHFPVLKGNQSEKSSTAPGGLLLLLLPLRGISISAESLLLCGWERESDRERDRQTGRGGGAVFDFNNFRSPRWKLDKEERPRKDRFP